MIEKKEIEELKAKYTDIYASTLSWEDEEGEKYQEEVIFRKPLVSDMESYQQEVQNSAVTANKNIFYLTVVSSNKKEVMEKIGDKVAVYGKYVEELTPFFGKAAKVTNRKL